MLRVRFVVDNLSPVLVARLSHTDEFTLVGETPDHQPVLSSPLWPESHRWKINLVSECAQGVLDLSGNWIEFGTGTEETSSFVFEVPNLVFTGAERLRDPVPEQEGIEWVFDRFSLTLLSQHLSTPLTVEFRQVSGFDSIVETLQRSGSIAITTHVRVQAVDGRLLPCEAVAEFMDDLLWLTAVAQGARVPWVAYQSFQEEQMVRHRRRWAPVDPYRRPRIGCIDLDPPGALRDFLDTTFARFDALLRARRAPLLGALHSYVAALSIPTFPLPIHLTARGFEAMIEALLSDSEQTYFSDPSEVTLVRAELKSALETSILRRLIASEPGLAKEFQETLHGKIKGVLRRPFGRLIRTPLTSMISRMNPNGLMIS